MAALMNHTVLPPGADDRDLLTALKYVIAGQDDVTISTPEGSAPLPDSVRRLLVDAVTALDRGQVVTVEPHRTVLTTQEAAELLGITPRRWCGCWRPGRFPTRRRAGTSGWSWRTCWPFDNTSARDAVRCSRRCRTRKPQTPATRLTPCPSTRGSRGRATGGCLSGSSRRVRLASPDPEQPAADAGRCRVVPPFRS